MNAPCCCKAATTRTMKTTAGSTTKTLARRGASAAGWVIPSVILAIMPKCPVCLAAYIAVGTGMGISIPSATYLRTLIMILCVTFMVSLAAKRLYHWLVRFPASPRAARPVSRSDAVQIVAHAMFPLPVSQDRQGLAPLAQPTLRQAAGAPGLREDGRSVVSSQALGLTLEWTPCGK